MGNFVKWLMILGSTACMSLGLCITMAIVNTVEAHRPQQAVLGTRSVPLLKVGRYQFRDLNRDGKLEPFEDWRLPADARAKDLLARLSVEEKAGLMMHGSLPSKESPSGWGTAYDMQAAEKLIVDGHVLTMITRLGTNATSFAAQNNKLQEIAEQGRFAIPLTISTDPRNVFEGTLGASTATGGFTKWPGTLGFAAAGDERLTQEFADAVRQEYLAVGIQESLSPQADLATEPRWPRIDGTFGEDPQLARRLVAAYIAGMQNGDGGLHAGSVAAVVKHWVGYGAAKQGWDSHNRYGRYADFNGGGSLKEHIVPFEGAFAAHVAAVMPTYSILEGATLHGQPLEQVGAGFNKQLLDGLLRGEYHYDGVILSDWLITADCVGQCRDGAGVGETATIVPGRHGMSWGVESLSAADRYAKAIDAGIDQFGGVSDAAILVELVKSGRVTEARLNQSVLRLLKQKFELGLFDNPFVDPDRAKEVVGRAQFVAQSLDAQHRAEVLLKTAPGAMPLRAGAKVYLSGVDAGAATAAGLQVVDVAEQADVIVMRLHAPHQMLHPGYFFGARQHEGDLDFKSDDPQFKEFQRLAATGKPLIVDVMLDRPAILTPIVAQAQVVIANFGETDTALLDVLMGKASATGRLPFELPRSMDAVRAQRSDTPHDSRDPLFPIGFTALLTK